MQGKEIHMQGHGRLKERIMQGRVSLIQSYMQGTEIHMQG